MIPDLIAIHLTTGKDLPGRVAVNWQRLPVERLFIGRGAPEVLTLIPRVFTLCAQAQTLAARLALCQAEGRAARASDQELTLLSVEAARETLRKLLLDWPLAFDGAPAEAHWIAAWRAARDMSALAALAQDYVFGLPPSEWLALGESGWLAWARQGRSAAARWLTRLAVRQPGCALLPLLQASDLIATADWLRSDGPCWQDQAREVGALAREAAHLPGLLAAGHLAQARLLARLLQLARWLSGQTRLEASVTPTCDGALALVNTTRGPLVHQLSLDARARVSAYRVVPPSAWHAEPRGLIWATLRAWTHACEQEWRLQVELIDPCVGFELNRQTKDTVHA